jgi:glycosyltransferase 2 family protein
MAGAAGQTIDVITHVWLTISLLRQRGVSPPHRIPFSNNREQPPKAPDFESVPPLPPKRKIWRFLFLLLFLGIALYFLLPRLAAMQQALAVVSRLRVHFVILSVISQILSYVGSGYLLRSVVSLSSKPVSVVDGMLVTVGANSVGTLGGGVLGTAGMTYLWLRRRGVNRGVAGLGGWVPILMNLVGLALFSLGGLVVLVHLKKSSTVLAAGLSLVALVLLVGLGTLVWCLTHRESLDGLVTRIAHVVAKLRRRPIDDFTVKITVGHLLAAWDALVQGGWRGSALGTVVNIGSDMLTLGFLFWAAGFPVSGSLLLAAYGVPQLLGKLTVILGGAGVVEAGMVALYVILGVPKAAAIVAVLGYRLLSFWLPTLIGIALVPFLSTRNQPPE